MFAGPTWWHHETKLCNKYGELNGEQREENVLELKTLSAQQGIFKKAKSQSDAAVKERFIAAEEIATSGHPYTKGEFLRRCMLKIYNTVCPEKIAIFHVQLAYILLIELLRHIKQ